MTALQKVMISLVLFLGAIMGAVWFLDAQKNKQNTNEGLGELSGRTYVYHQVTQNPYDEQDEIPYSMFDFALVFSTTSEAGVSGWWFGAWHNASRVNGCIAEDEPCFSGKTQGGSAIIKFNACYADGEGEARITYNKTRDQIEWKVTKQSSAECYVPDEAILERDE